MSTDKASDANRATSGVHTSPFLSSFFAPAKLPKRPQDNSIDKPAPGHEHRKATRAPAHEQAQGSAHSSTRRSPVQMLPPKQTVPLKVASLEFDTNTMYPSGSSQTTSLQAYSTTTTHNAPRVSATEKATAVAASSSFYSSAAMVPAAAHARTSYCSAQNRPSNCSGYSMSPSAARLRPSALSRSSSTTGANNNNNNVYGLDRLDALSGSARPSMDAFARTSISSCVDVDSHAIARAVAVTRSLPRELSDCARHLSAFSPDCLLPAQVMARLWKVELEHACKLISLLGDAGVVRHATLESGAMWCVPTRTFAAALRHVFREESAIMHAAVLAVYEDMPTFSSWESVKDDGFIVLQLMRHLAVTRRLDDIRSLLLSGTWLENKTHWHGPAAVAKDFHAAVSADEALAPICTLLMQAYTISVPSAVAMPHSGTLLAQMLMRTAAITHLAPDSLDPAFFDWWHTKVKEMENAIVKNFRGLANTNFTPTPVHLLSLTTTLAQACGSTRLVIKSHQCTINAVALTESSDELVAACSDGKLRTYELQFGAKMGEFSGMGLPLIDVQACSHSRFATVSEQCPVVEIWCIEEGRVVMTLTGAQDPVTRLLVHPRGTTALVGSEGGDVRMYSLVDGSCELVMANANEPVTAISVAWNVSAALSSPIAACGHMTGGIIVWDLMGEPEDLPICQLRGHKAGVTGLDFFNRGECLISSSLDGAVIVWDMISGTRQNVLVGHSAPVNGVLVEPRQEQVALTWSDDSTAIVWSLETGQQRTVLRGDTSYIVCACFVPAEQSDSGSGGGGGGPTRLQVVTATGDGSVSVWDAQSGELLQLLVGHSLAVKSVVVGSQGLNLVSVSEDKTVHLWDLRSKVVDMPMPHRTGINAMQAFGNSEALVTYGTSGSMQLWDCSAMSLSDSGARETLEINNPPMFTATSANGRLLASVAANSHTVLRDPSTLSIIHEMPPRLGSRVRSAAFSGDCKLMAVVLQDSSITIWDITRNEIMWQPQGRGMMAAVDAHHVGVNGCFLSEKGDTLVTISKDCTARVWNVILRQASHICSGHSSPVRCGWLSKDGSLLITGSEDSTARVWDTSTGRAMIVLAHNHSVTFVEGTDNKRRALTCSNCGAAWLWNVEDGECTAVLRVAEKTIMYSGFFLQDARLLVTRHSTASLAVWHVATGALVAFFACDSRVSHLACTPQGVLAAGTETGAIHFLQLPLRSGSRSFNTGTSDGYPPVPSGPRIVHARTPQKGQKGSMEKPRIARAL